MANAPEVATVKPTERITGTVSAELYAATMGGERFDLRMEKGEYFSHILETYAKAKGLTVKEV